MTERILFVVIIMMKMRTILINCSSSRFEIYVPLLPCELTELSLNVTLLFSDLDSIYR